MSTDVEFWFAQIHPTPELPSSAAASEASPFNASKSRTNYIRRPLLPSYSPISEATSEPLPLRLPQLSNGTMSLPEPPALGDIGRPFTADRTVEEAETTTPSRLITSTPPTSIKPRSAYARRILASQSKEKSKHLGKAGFVVSGSAGLRKSRKSIRMSCALSKRPSLFGPPLSDEEHADDADGVFNVICSS